MSACSFCGRADDRALYLIAMAPGSDAICCEKCVEHAAVGLIALRTPKADHRAVGAPFTEAQEARLREIVAEEMRAASQRAARLHYAVTAPLPDEQDGSPDPQGG